MNMEIGPKLGYVPNPPKTVLTIKEGLIEEARRIFVDTGVQITNDGSLPGNPLEEGHRHLGAAVGTERFQKEFVRQKVNCWVSQLEKLSEIAKQEPQLAFTAYAVSLSRRWMYIMRTVKNVAELFQPLENCIQTKFLPAIMNNYAFNITERRIFALPIRYGGLGIFNPVELCMKEFQRSRKVTEPLVQLIKQQNIRISAEVANITAAAIKNAKKEISDTKQEEFKLELITVKNMCSEKMQRCLSNLSEKGTGCWLTVLPLNEFGFVLNKQEFTDAIKLRYCLELKDIPRFCSCGKENSIDHALSCSKGGYSHLRHNQMRDLQAHWLSDVCYDVRTEPTVLPLTGERFHYRSANIAEGARLDISARGVWTSMDKTFFDVRIFHPEAKSNIGEIKQICSNHEAEKKRTYNDRVLQVEKSSFTPLVFSTTGVMGTEAERFNKRLASLMSQKRCISYSEAIGYIRTKLRFCLLRCTLAAIRGFRGQKITEDDRESDVNLIQTTTHGT